MSSEIFNDILPKDEMTVKFLSNNTVQIKHAFDLGIKTKTIPFGDFVQSILSAKEDCDIQESIETPILPQAKGISTVQHKKLSSGSEYIVMVREAGQFDINYFGDVFKNCGIPKLLFAIKILNNVMQSVFVMAVKDYIISDSTQIFAYPFSNSSSYSAGKICFGANRISEIDVKSTVMLHSIPNMFLAMENNNDAYGQNLSGLEYRPLLEALVDKPFNEEWLKPVNSTYSSWFDSLS